MAAALVACEAQASFHFMQIEQVIGGVGGDTTQQAIQLRQRSGNQNLMSFARLRAFDAGGTNAVMLIDMTTDVGNTAGGSRILVATQAFATAQGITPDFVMDPIPTGYLSAGRIAFEQDTGLVYWSVAWGGAGYTGTNMGSTTNDDDGNFNPPEVMLPTAGTSALQFGGAANALSTNNLADYSVTAGAAVFINGAGQSVTVTAGAGDDIFDDGFEEP
jgi:hypothetical protein